MTSNHAILCAVIAWLAAQIIKGILYRIVNKHFVLGRLTGSGGMPSSHSAAVTAFAAAIGIQYGLNSFEFSMAGFLAIIVTYDACNVRWVATQHAKRLNKLEEVYPVENTASHKKFNEFIGHTPLQVIVGALLGLSTSLIANIVVGGL